jgi:hypothetical protein
MCFQASGLVIGMSLQAATPDVDAGHRMAVIVSPSFPETQVSIPELKRIFLGQRLFSSAVRLKTLHNQNPHLRDSFLRQVLDMSWPEFQIYCLTQLCKDGVYSPRFLNDDEMIQTVQSDPGTLGYLPLEAARTQSNVRILLILPEDAGK